MTFELKRLGRQKVRYDSANDDNLLRYQLVVDGAKVTPTSATISIYKPSSKPRICRHSRRRSVACSAIWREERAAKRICRLMGVGGNARHAP